MPRHSGVCAQPLIKFNPEISLLFFQFIGVNVHRIAATYALYMRQVKLGLQVSEETVLDTAPKLCCSLRWSGAVLTSQEKAAPLASKPDVIVGDVDTY